MPAEVKPGDWNAEENRWEAEDSGGGGGVTPTSDDVGSVLSAGASGKITAIVPEQTVNMAYGYGTAADVDFSMVNVGDRVGCVITMGNQTYNLGGYISSVGSSKVVTFSEVYVEGDDYIKESGEMYNHTIAAYPVLPVSIEVIAFVRDGDVTSSWMTGIRFVSLDSIEPLVKEVPIAGSSSVTTYNSATDDINFLDSSNQKHSVVGYFVDWLYGGEPLVLQSSGEFFFMETVEHDVIYPDTSTVGVHVAKPTPIIHARIQGLLGAYLIPMDADLEYTQGGVS